MGYDGGFTKIRMKMENQQQLDNYELNLRKPIYNTIGRDNFYKFEVSAVDLRYLNNDWAQTHCLRKVMDNSQIRNYERDDTKFTYITKETLKKYIVEVKKDYEEKLLEYGEDEENGWYKNDIELLEYLYNNFKWEEDTLVFSYSY